MAEWTVTLQGNFPADAFPLAWTLYVCPAMHVVVKSQELMSYICVDSLCIFIKGCKCDESMDIFFYCSLNRDLWSTIESNGDLCLLMENSLLVYLIDCSSAGWPFCPEHPSAIGPSREFCANLILCSNYTNFLCCSEGPHKVVNECKLYAYPYDFFFLRSSS